jgi:hypothetical protein
VAFPLVAARSTGEGDMPATLTLPTGIAAGHLLVTVVSADGVTTMSDSTGKWTKLAQATQSTTTPTSAVFYRTATGTDDSLVVTGTVIEPTTYVIWRITGGGSVSGSSATGTTANANPPSHTPPGGSADYLWIAAMSTDNVTIATAAPTNYSPLTTEQHSFGSGASTSVAERSLTASTEDPGAFTSVAEEWVAWTLAIAPAASIPTGYDEVRLFTRT